MTDAARALDPYGWSERWSSLADAAGGTPGRVVRQDRGWVQVASVDGIVSVETRSKQTGVPVVGDWVVMVDGMVTAILERTGVLRRADPSGEGVQHLAANIDRVLIVAGADRPIRDGRVQRSVAQAWDASAEPLVVVTKTDLAADLDAIVGDLRRDHPGTPVLAVSSTTGEGLDALRAEIRGTTVVLLGESGAGKSTLLNALAERDHADTGAVRSTDRKGRHTTTRRELYVLANSTIVIDTPGVRAVGLFTDTDSLDATFPDVDEHAADCRFSDCSHRTEPGCAVRAATDDGRLAPQRLADYLALRAEIDAGAEAAEQQRRRRRS